MEYLKRLVLIFACIGCLGVTWYAFADPSIRPNRLDSARVLSSSATALHASADKDEISSHNVEIESQQESVPIKSSEESNESIQDMLKTAAEMGDAFWYILLLAFLAGVITSFTPCVYPMIPITVGILQAQGSRTIGRNVMSAISYVLGISVVYSTLGYFAAKSATIFGQWVVNPWVVGFIILFFLYLAFSLFGFYEMYIPGFMNRQGNFQSRGSLFKIFIFGMLSGTIASPCLTPALAVLLGIVAKMAHPFLGFLTLFAFSIGMGTLLIAIGTFSGALALLPRAGVWMIEVKRIMAFAILAMIVYFVQPLLTMRLGAFLGDSAAMLMYSAVAFCAAAYFFLSAGAQKIKLLLGLLCGLGGIFLMMGNLGQISAIFSRLFS